MNYAMKLQTLAATLVVGVLLSSCNVEDPGPRQEGEKRYSVIDFDRVEIGHGFHVEVRYDEIFSVSVRGDRRNLDDLVVKNEGGTLVVRYDDARRRRHETYVYVTMPQLKAVHFSGGVNANVSRFDDLESLNVYLSGGSLCQLNVSTPRLKAVLTGASHLTARGYGETMTADLSGASILKAFNFPVEEASVVASGASMAELTAASLLDARASGASHIRYRGTPIVESEVSGASTVRSEP
jgi:hypothetical protein